MLFQTSPPPRRDSLVGALPESNVTELCKLLRIGNFDRWGIARKRPGISILDLLDSGVMVGAIDGGNGATEVVAPDRDNLGHFAQAKRPQSVATLKSVWLRKLWRIDVRESDGQDLPIGGPRAH